MGSPDDRTIADSLIAEGIRTGVMTLQSGLKILAGTKEFDAIWRMAMEVRRETPKKKQASINPDSLKLQKTAKEAQP